MNKVGIKQKYARFICDAHMLVTFLITFLITLLITSLITFRITFLINSLITSITLSSPRLVLLGQMDVVFINNESSLIEIYE